MTEAQTNPTESIPTESANVESACVTPVADRVQFALRQAALVALSLLIAGLVAERLRPATVIDRGLVSAIFWWAIIVWLVALLVNATAFEHSQVRGFDGPPLVAAIAIAGVSLLTGLIQLGMGSFVYVLATALGTAMFWWGLLGLVLLLVRRVAS